jgi:transmembrane sensor
MITEDILVKYLAGETEPHEVAMIEQWRRDSEENEKHFRQLEKLWIGSAGLQKSNAVNVDEAWQKVRSKVHTSSKGKVLSLNTRWLVAASLVLLIGLAVFFTTRTASTGAEMISLNAVKTMETLQLSDGSKLLVKSGQVSYPKTFDGSRRKVKLHSGKVFFEIAPDKEKPFEIEANQTLVTVLGTKFEVVSYADYTQVMVKEGKVKFTTPGGESILTAGMAAKYDHKGNTLENMQVTGKNTFAYTSGRLTFENDRLGQVVADLNRFYASEVELENPALANCVITSSFSNEKLENVLAVVAGTLGLEIVHVPNSNKIILKGKGCTP